MRVSERRSAYRPSADFKPGGREAEERPYRIESIWRSQQDIGPRTGAANPASGQCKGTTPALFAQDGPSFSTENTMSWATPKCWASGLVGLLRTRSRHRAPTVPSTDLAVGLGPLAE